MIRYLLNLKKKIIFKGNKDMDNNPDHLGIERKDLDLH